MLTTFISQLEAKKTIDELAENCKIPENKRKLQNGNNIELQKKNLISLSEYHKKKHKVNVNGGKNSINLKNSDILNKNSMCSSRSGLSLIEEKVKEKNRHNNINCAKATDVAVHPFNIKKFYSRTNLYENASSNNISSSFKPMSQSVKSENCNSFNPFKSTLDNSSKEKILTADINSNKNSKKNILLSYLSETEICQPLDHELTNDFSNSVKSTEPNHTITISSDEESYSTKLNYANFHDSKDTSSETSSMKSSNMSGGSPLKENFVNVVSKKIYIGSYKANPVERISISEGCFSIKVPTLSQEEEPALLILKYKGLQKVFACLEGPIFVISIIVKPKCAQYVQRHLRMTHKQRPYLDPMDKDRKLKYITILLENIHQYEKASLHKFLNVGENIFEYITSDRANEILSYSIEEVEENFFNHIEQKIKCTKLFSYPPNMVGGITVTTDDYYCLEAGQFLNDVIIDFYLKWLQTSKLSKQDQERTYIFSTFFYNSLTTKSLAESNVPVPWQSSGSKRRHDRVKSWTKNVDIFSKDFILFPINESSHWFLVIVCFPNLLLQIEHNTQTSRLELGNKWPCILAFDSMIEHRNRVISTLRQYILEEYSAKHNRKINVTKEDFPGFSVDVPCQTNYSDCGLYTLQYAESFFENPIRDYRPPITSLLEWFSRDSIKHKREAIADLIKLLMIESNPDNDLKLPKLQFISEECSEKFFAEDESEFIRNKLKEFDKKKSNDKTSSSGSKLDSISSKNLCKAGKESLFTSNRSKEMVVKQPDSNLVALSSKSLLNSAESNASQSSKLKTNSINESKLQICSSVGPSRNLPVNLKNFKIPKLNKNNDCLTWKTVAENMSRNYQKLNEENNKFDDLLNTCRNEKKILNEETSRKVLSGENSRKFLESHKHYGVILENSISKNSVVKISGNNSDGKKVEAQLKSEDQESRKFRECENSEILKPKIIESNTTEERTKSKILQAKEKFLRMSQKFDTSKWKSSRALENMRKNEISQNLNKANLCSEKNKVELSPLDFEKVKSHEDNWKNKIENSRNFRKYSEESLRDSEEQGSKICLESNFMNKKAGEDFPKFDLFSDSESLDSKSSSSESSCKISDRNKSENPTSIKTFPKMLSQNSTLKTENKRKICDDFLLEKTTSSGGNFAVTDPSENFVVTNSVENFAVTNSADAASNTNCSASDSKTLAANVNFNKTYSIQKIISGDNNLKTSNMKKLTPNKKFKTSNFLSESQDFPESMPVVNDGIDSCNKGLENLKLNTDFKKSKDAFFKFEIGLVSEENSSVSRELLYEKSLKHGNAKINVKKSENVSENSEDQRINFKSISAERLKLESGEDKIKERKNFVENPKKVESFVHPNEKSSISETLNLSENILVVDISKSPESVNMNLKDSQNSSGKNTIDSNVKSSSKNTKTIDLDIKPTDAIKNTINSSNEATLFKKKESNPSEKKELLLQSSLHSEKNKSGSSERIHKTMKRPSTSPQSSSSIPSRLKRRQKKKSESLEFSKTEFQNFEILSRESPRKLVEGKPGFSLGDYQQQSEELGEPISIAAGKSSTNSTSPILGKYKMNQIRKENRNPTCLENELSTDSNVSACSLDVLNSAMLSDELSECPESSSVFPMKEDIIIDSDVIIQKIKESPLLELDSTSKSLSAKQQDTSISEVRSTSKLYTSKQKIPILEPDSTSNPNSNILKQGASILGLDSTSNPNSNILKREVFILDIDSNSSSHKNINLNPTINLSSNNGINEEEITYIDISNSLESNTDSSVNSSSHSRAYSIDGESSLCSEESLTGDVKRTALYRRRII